MVDLAGFTVLVTGVTGGLGPAVAEALRAAGARVVGVGRSRQADVQADLLTAEGARQAVAAVGELDVVVHLMGGFTGGRPVWETDEASWDGMLALNVKSAYLILRAALPGMLARGRGRVVVVGSKAGESRPAGLSAYAVSKAALHALVEVVAKETKGSGVTVNAVLPGTIDTPANRQAMPEADRSEWVTPEAIARQIVWLASAESAAVTGVLMKL